MNRCIAVFMALLVPAVFCAPVRADVEVNNLAARVRVTSSGGTAAVYEAGGRIPEPPSGSLIEILEGSADVSLGAGSSVDLVVGPYRASLSGDDYVAVSFDPLSGRVELERVTGSVLFSSSGGQAVLLDEKNPEFISGPSAHPAPGPR